MPCLLAVAGGPLGRCQRAGRSACLLACAPEQQLAWVWQAWLQGGVLLTCFWSEDDVMSALLRVCVPLVGGHGVAQAADGAQALLPAWSAASQRV